MKLIRLQTDDSHCVFDNSFNTDIIIEPNAKIALQNVAIVKNPARVNLTLVNNKISYKLGLTAPNQDVKLTVGTYTQNNYETLFSDMTTKLNQSLTSSSTSNVGQQWLVSLDNGRASIQQKLSNKLNYIDWQDTIAVKVTAGATGAGAGATVQGDSNVGASNFTQFFYNPHSVLKGCGTFSARIVTSGTDGFMIGLVEKQESTIQSIPEAQFVHAIRASPTQNYIPFNNGSNQTQTASLQFASSDYVYLHISNGAVEYTINNASGTTKIYSAPLDQTKTYYPAMVFFGNTKVRSIFYNPDPYESSQTTPSVSALEYLPSHFHLPDGNPWSQTGGSFTENFYSDNVGAATYRRVSSGGWTHYWKQTGLTTWNIYFTLPTQFSVPDNTAEIDPITHIISFSSTATTFVPNKLLSPVDSTTLALAPPANGRSGLRTITFSKDLGTFLGYNYTSNTTEEAVLDQQWLANSIFDPTDTADSFVVELLSLDLDSYDGQTSDRRSILATVPKSESADGTIIYDVNYPTFISIRNQNKLTLRNIRARILKSDLTPFTVVGTSNVTLLLD